MKERVWRGGAAIPSSPRVRCKTGETQWSAGVVIAHDYREDSFPPGFAAAYQVKLVDGQLIFAPFDSDECIRAE